MRKANITNLCNEESSIASQNHLQYAATTPMKEVEKPFCLGNSTMPL